jgi:CRISPR system Cascade subunit CasA
MRAFNLIMEDWVPVRMLNGRLEELGIRDTLLRSKEIARIEDTSPLVVASLHRLLLAVLYRALDGPTDIDQAEQLFREGLPNDKVTAYLKTWHDRFWLFDEESPFYQVPDYEPKADKKGAKQWRSWSALAAEHNVDNNKVLFDHVDVTHPGTIPSASAAKWLVACQTFALGGGKSEFCYTRTAPSGTAVMALPLGADLHDTLVLLLVPENREIMRNDIPIWEREPDTAEYLRKCPERSPSGLADLYTWRTRSIKLNPDSSGSVISGVAFASGVGVVHGGLLDSMLAYSIHEKHGLLPIQFRERAFWRDFDSLLPDPDDLHRAPKVIENARALARSDKSLFPHAVMVLGQANNQAKVEFWRMERFALSQALLGSNNVRSEIKELLDVANKAEQALSEASRNYARAILSRGERLPSKDDITKFVRQMPCQAHYWSTLEARFHDLLGLFTPDFDEEDIRGQWLQWVRDALSESWQVHRASASLGDAWSIRALVKAEGAMLRKLKELETEIEKLQPQEEGV